MFGKKKKERIAKLERALEQQQNRTQALEEASNRLLLEHGKSLDKLRAAYMEMLTKTPSEEQVRDNIAQMLGDEDKLSVVWDRLTSNGKRRITSSLMEFIRDDDYTSQYFHEVMDAPIQHVINNMCGTVSEEFVESTANDAAQEYFDNNIDDAIECALDEFKKTLEPEELEEEMDRVIYNATISSVRRMSSTEIKRHIQEMAQSVLNTLTKPVEQSKEDAIKQVAKYNGATQHFDGVKMRYTIDTGRGPQELSESRYKDMVANAMKNPRLR